MFKDINGNPSSQKVMATIAFLTAIVFMIIHPDKPEGYLSIMGIIVGARGIQMKIERDRGKIAKRVCLFCNDIGKIAFPKIIYFAIVLAACVMALCRPDNLAGYLGLYSLGLGGKAANKYTEKIKGDK